MIVYNIRQGTTKLCGGFIIGVLVTEVSRFIPDLSLWTPWEQQRMQGADWHHIDALPQQLWPSRLRDLVVATPGRPVMLGTREESTVPLTEAEWQQVKDAARGDG